MSFKDVQGIFDGYDIAQNELELSDDTEHFGGQDQFEIQY